MSVHGLDLGALDLASGIPSDDGYTLSVLAAGATFGEPAAVVREIVSQLADGSLVTYDRAGNRVVSFEVQIKASDGAALQAGEVALRRELYRPNVVTWTPPADFSAPSVYEVITSEMSQRFDDLEELRNTRRFLVTLTCKPFARSVELVTVEGLAPPPVTPTTATVNAADTITGWTTYVAAQSGASALGTPTDGGSYLYVAENGTMQNGLTTVELRFSTSAVSMSATPYLLVEAKFATYGPGYIAFRAILNGVERSLAPVFTRATATGTTVYALNTDGQSLTGLAVAAVNVSPSPDQTRVEVHDVTRTDTLTQTSPRQVSRIIGVGGTERTPASLRAYTSSGFLGVTLLHTTPHDGSGYTPDMRRWRATGNTTYANVGTRKITGTYEPMRPNAVTSRTPAHSMPRGDYILCAAIKSDTATTTSPFPISWAVKSVISGQTIGSIEGTGYGWFPVANELTIVPIAAVQAPIVRSGALDVEVHLLNPTNTLALDVEEWWMFTDDDDSALSIVNTSEGNLWLDSADVDSPVPTVWVGPDKPNSYHPSGGLVAQGTHTFKPGPLLVTSISDSNNYLEAELTYHEHWHSNAI